MKGILKRGLASAVVAHSLAVTGVIAQPGPAEPPVFVDLGDIGYGNTVSSPGVAIDAGGHAWFRFRLIDPITPQLGWLDIDTHHPDDIRNNDLALYDNQKNRIARDNDSAGSDNSSNPVPFAAGMSFGSGSGERVTRDPASGVFSDGFENRDLEPGVYWACIGGFDSDFDDPNNNWIANSDSAAVGTVRITVSAGEKPAGYFNERHMGADAGRLPYDALVAYGKGPLETIMCSFADSPRGIDTFRIRITDPSAFQAVAEASNYDAGRNNGQGGGRFGTRLYLFYPDGRAIAGARASDGQINALTPSQVASFPPGEYCLAISTACLGENSQDPYPYSEGGPMYAFTGVGQAVTIAPNGSGANEPVRYWGRMSECSGIDAIVAKISLTGAAFVPEPCVADINGDGLLNTADINLFVQSFLSGCE